MELTSRYRGALLGLAAGDALGTTLEFSRPGSFAPIADMVGGGPFRLRPGEWTDDTSMALCLAESLAEVGGFDPIDQLRRYVRWFRKGHLSSNGTCFDIGKTTREALLRFEDSGKPWCGPTEADTAGNGSLMRLAPVPMFFRSDPAKAIDYAAQSSRTTHGAPEAVDACRYYGALIVGALNGVEKDALLAPGFWSRGTLEPAIEEVAAGSFKKREPPIIKGSGYVVRSLEAALWALHRSGSFREGALLAANLGNDADTTAAIYGQLAGAIYGDAGIPEAWRSRLAHKDVILGLADRLLQGRPQPP